MDTKLAILSGAAFAGVVLGGALVANPSIGASISPASVWSQAARAIGNDGSDGAEVAEREDDEWEADEDDGREEHEALESREHSVPRLPFTFGERSHSGESHEEHDDD